MHQVSHPRVSWELFLTSAGFRHSDRQSFVLDTIDAYANTMLVFIASTGPLDLIHEIFLFKRAAKIRRIKTACVFMLAVSPDKDWGPRCVTRALRAITEMERRAENLCRDQQPLRLSEFKAMQARWATEKMIWYSCVCRESRHGKVFVGGSRIA